MHIHCKITHKNNAISTVSEEIVTSTKKKWISLEIPLFTFYFLMSRSVWLFFYTVSFSTALFWLVRVFFFIIIISSHAYHHGIRSVYQVLWSLSIRKIPQVSDGSSRICVSKVNEIRWFACSSQVTASIRHRTTRVRGKWEIFINNEQESFKSEMIW